MVDSPYNCITLCTGSLGSDPDNHLPEIIRHFGRKNRIAFVHARNLKIEEPGKFYESSHLSEDGSFDMYEIMKALNEVGYDGSEEEPDTDFLTVLLESRILTVFRKV